MKKQTKTIWVAVATIAGLAVVLVFAFVHQNKQTTREKQNLSKTEQSVVICS